MFPFIDGLSLIIRRFLLALTGTNDLHKIGRKYITEVHRAQQTMWQELIRTDRGVGHTFPFIDGLSLIIRRLSFNFCNTEL